MRRKSILLSPAAIMVVLTLCSSTLAVEVLEQGYDVRTYATYSSAGIEYSPYKMVFADNGNLYVTHLNEETIWCITPDGAATKLVGGLNGAQGIDWGGGTDYGDYLYVAANGGIVRVGLDGTTANFANRYCAGALGIDRTGNYGGYMYTTTGCQDHVYRIDFAGNVTMFSDWPTWIDGGGPHGIGFDTGGNYGGFMYVATSYVESQAQVSGLFFLDTAGNATRFTEDLVQAHSVNFDPTGRFDGDMFVIGRSGFDQPDSIWRVEPEGTATVFANIMQSRPRGLTFSPDGAMYVAEYDEGSETVVVSEITSEGSDLIGLEISGPDEVAENFTAGYKAIAFYDDDSTMDVTASALWAVEPNMYATIEAGMLTTEDIVYDQSATILAGYTEGGVTVAAEKTIDILAICPTGTALAFDGVDDYVDCGSDQSLDVTELTWSLWIKRAETTYTNERALISNEGGGENTGGTYALQIDVGSQRQDKIQFVRHGDGTWPISNTAIQDTDWHYIAVTRNDSGVTVIYIDGLQDAEGTVATRTAFTKTVIGAGHTSYSNFNGLIDEVAIYNRALSAEEIRANMYTRLVGDEPGLVGYWDFDEGQGQIVYDLSGNGNNGQLGSTPDVDGSDPAWIESDAPIGRCTPYLIATGSIKEALKQKKASLEKLQAAMAQEWTAYQALEELLETGDYGDLKKGDIITAKQRIHSAIKHQEQAINTLQKSINQLEDALIELGYEPMP